MLKYYKSNSQTLINIVMSYLYQNSFFYQKKIIFISNTTKSLFNKDILYQKNF